MEEIHFFSRNLEQFLWREFTPFIVEEKSGALIVERIRCILWKWVHFCC